jgi:hypothetical protein
MGGKLRRAAAVSTASASSYMGLLVLTWLMLNFRLFTAALIPIADYAGLAIILVFFCILLFNIIPAVVLNKLRVRQYWPYLATVVPTGLLSWFALAYWFDYETTLGASLPRGPGGVIVASLMVISPAEFVQKLAQFGGELVDVRGLDLTTALGTAMLFVPSFVGGGLYWLVFVRWLGRKRAQ